MNIGLKSLRRDTHDVFAQHKDTAAFRAGSAKPRHQLWGCSPGAATGRV
jgi:hypothetical protein